MSNSKRKMTAEEYWENIYERESQEIPRNDAERRALELLGKGFSTSGACEEAGMNQDEFYELLNRCNEWECNPLNYITKREG